MSSSSSITPYEPGTAAYRNTTEDLTGDTSDEDWSKPKQLNTTRKTHSPEFDLDFSGMENIDGHAAPLAASLDHWQFGELEIFPHLQTTVTERLGEDGKELRKMLSAMERATKSYMVDCGHGPDDLNSVQMLSGYRYTDLDRSLDLMNFIFPREPGTSLLALGSYGAACGKTLISYTGRVIERALAGAASSGLLFLDILNISVDVVEDFKGTNGNRMFKSKKCMKHPSFRTLQDTIQKVTVEVYRLRLKLNKQASIVLLRLGPSIQAAWDPIIKYCENQFQGGNEDNTYRVIIHDTMPFHPSALYIHALWKR
jgi:hypothetical protein